MRSAQPARRSKPQPSPCSASGSLQQIGAHHARSATQRLWAPCGAAEPETAGTRHVRDEDGAPIRYTVPELKKAAAEGSKLAEQYLDVVLHYKEFWTALKQKRYYDALRELGTGLRARDGHYLIMGSPQIIGDMVMLARDVADTPWATREAAAVTGFLSVIGPRATGGFPADPNRFFDKAMKALPKDPVIPWYHATYSIAQGNLRDTLKYLKEAVSRGMPEGQILSERAATLWRLGRGDEARDDYRTYLGLEGVEHDKEYVVAFFQMAQLEVDGNDLKAALWCPENHPPAGMNRAAPPPPGAPRSWTP